MFAGPNGSGKTTIKNLVGQSCALGFYLNADEMESAMRSDSGWRLPAGFPPFSPESLRAYLASSPRLPNSSHPDDLVTIRADRTIVCAPEESSGYLAAVLSEFLRETLLRHRAKFSFETVMSHQSKVDILRLASAAGYRTYLYFVATGSTELNLSRIAARVQAGGHSVPDEKVVTRYPRTLELLPEAIQAVDRAYIFDNSTEGQGPSLIARYEQFGEFQTLPSTRVPRWFSDAVLDSVESSESGDLEEHVDA